jgi:hypothetical protein
MINAAHRGLSTRCLMSPEQHLEAFPAHRQLMMELPAIGHEIL